MASGPEATLVAGYDGQRHRREKIVVSVVFWWSIGVFLVDEYLARRYGGPAPFETLRAEGPLVITGLAGGAIALIILLPSMRRRTISVWRALQISALIPVGLAAAPFGLWATTRIRPQTYDGALLAFDQTLRVPASAWIGGLFRDQPVVVGVCYAIYAALPPLMAAAMAWEFASASSRVRPAGALRPDLILAYLVTGVSGIVLYVVLPAAGPFYAFGAAFPAHLPDAFTLAPSPQPWAPGAPRNCMPSLHFAWALMLWRSVAGSNRPFRWSGLGFVLLTALATIGSGEHYLIDLVVAVPFAVAVLALVTPTDGQRERAGPRRRAAAGGLALTASWFCLILAGHDPLELLRRTPVLAWVLMLGTVSAAAILELSRASVTPGGQVHGDSVEPG